MATFREWLKEKNNISKGETWKHGKEDVEIVNVMDDYIEYKMKSAIQVSTGKGKETLKTMKMKKDIFLKQAKKVK